MHSPSRRARPALPDCLAALAFLMAVAGAPAILAQPTNFLPRTAPLAPSDAAGTFKVDDDLVWEQVLAEPVISQPLFVAFDERRRLWVVEYRQYPNPAGIKMVSHDNFWRAVYDKVPPPPPNHFRGLDRISIHEDTAGNGTYDKHKVFVDGLNIATSIAFGRGGVFVLNPPYLLFYPDKNHDDVPDGDPSVLLSGFGLEDTHSVANSLRWGPDGWLYGCQGSTVTGNILVHGADGKPLSPKPVFSQGQNIWRYHPEKRIYEVFSEGGGNAFGLEIDSAGRIFSGHNGGNTRGFHYMQGAYLQKGFDKHGPLSNPYAFGYFPQMPHNDVDRFTHNFLVYDSGALGERHQGHLFGVEPLQGRIVESEITRDGSTFRTRDLGHPVVGTDHWFRPVDIKLGPDGALYVCDWYDKQVNHYRNHEGQMDASNGRVYRLGPKIRVGIGNAGATTYVDVPRSQGNPDVKRDPNLTALDSRLLATYLRDPNRWHREQAVRILADRRVAGEDVAAGLPALPADGASLETLWALNAAGRFDETLATEALGHGNPQVRAWAVRLIGDPRSTSPALAKRLADLAASEPEVEVRTQLASTARRLPATQSLPILRALMDRDRDAGDPRQPLLIWWALEEKMGTDRDAVLALFSERELWRAPIVRTHLLPRLMRRLAATGKRDDLLAAARLFAMSPAPDLTARLTQGFEEAYKGRPLVGLPEELLSAMEKSGGESLLIATRRGKPDAVKRALATVADPKADASLRLQLAQILGESRQPGAVPVLLAVARDAKDSPLRRAAIGALQPFDAPAIASDILAQLPSYPPDVRAGALSLLASRAAWAGSLLGSVESGTTPADAVPRDLVRRIRALHDPALDARATKLWPAVKQATSAEMEREIARLSEMINAATGTPYAGKKLFAENCAVCHRLFAKGGEVGPDLTVYKRDDLANLLLNIVNPSAEIREGYEATIVETKDGRVLTGFVADKDPQVLVLRTPDGQTVALPRAEVASQQPAQGSLMPEGLLSNLGDQQIRDLFAYLRSTQPLNDGN